MGDQPVGEQSAGDPVESLDAALRSLLPAAVRGGARAIDADDLERIHPAERAIVAAAGPARRAEFASGRMLLHLLLADQRPILVSPSRAPQLPPGWRCSLAHDHGVVVALVGSSSDVRGLGIDVEPRAELEPEVADVIRRESERHLDPSLVFVLKEAVYKAWSDESDVVLEHHDVEVVVDLAAGEFRARVIGSEWTFVGHHRDVAGRWLAAVVVRA